MRTLWWLVLAVGLSVVVGAMWGERAHQLDKNDDADPYNAYLSAIFGVAICALYAYGTFGYYAMKALHLFGP